MDARLLHAHLSSCLVLLCVGAASIPPVGGAAASPSTKAVQMAGAGGSYKSAARPYKSRESETGSGDDEPAWSRSNAVKVPGQFKSNPSGYDPERTRNFWRLYHGARPGPEDKPKRPKEAR